MLGIGNEHIKPSPFASRIPSAHTCSEGALLNRLEHCFMYIHMILPFFLDVHVCDDLSLLRPPNPQDYGRRCSDLRYSDGLGGRTSR